MLTVNDVRNMLPKVGDIRREIPTIPDKVQSPEPRECIVVEVNRAHLWYRVRFTGSGFIECYKLPQTGRLAWEVEK